MKHKIYLGLMVLGFNAVAQIPTGTPSGPVPATFLNTSKAWFRGGNTATGAGASDNIFGTGAGFNSAIFHQTAGITRMQMNGTVSNVVNVGANLPKDGFIGIGTSTGFYNGSGPGQGPFSLLHLNGINGLGSPQSLGYRDWMRYGITSTHNQDLMYIGQRNTGGNDVTDAVIGWADNFGSTSPVGPDNLTFNFLTGAGQSGTDDLVGTANFGREIMRMTGTGQVGIGPRFNNANQPKSTLHQHQENAQSSWMQITNQYMTQGSPIQTVPTPIAATNGFRFGILGNGLKAKNGNAFVYNQEERHLIFSTNHVNPTDAQFTNERMRITNISAPTNLTNNPGSAFGIWNPGNITNQDLTRVAISHDPTNPVTRPLALLHLGYNTGSIINPTTTDGWRTWMDVGTFVSRGSDNMYIGLKPEGGLANDRQDAVISFGDNYTNVIPGLTIAPDKLRIIFTSPLAGLPAPGPGAMSTQDGLEFVRYVPFHNTSLAVNDPRTGFGDFQNLLPVGTINPGNTVEINSIMNGFNAVANTNVTGSYLGSTGASGLRFRDLTSLSTIVPSTETAVNHTKVLSVDTLGNVVLIDNGGSGSGIGNYCSDTTQNPLTGDYQIPMAGFNYNYTTPINTSSSFHIGNPVCAPTVGRLNVYNDNLQVGGAFGNNLNTATNSFGIFSNITNLGAGQLVAVQGTANSSGVNSIARGLRGEGIALNGSIAQGVKGTANTNNNCKQNIAIGALAANGTIISLAGDFDVEQSNSPLNQGVNIEVFNGINPSSTNFGVNAFVRNPGVVNYGGFFVATSASQNIGVYGDAGGSISGVPPTPGQTNLAGFFNGDVYISGAFGPSDINLKENIDTIVDALSIIKQLKPKSFDYKHSSYPSMNLPNGKQFGLIAQEVETVIPELISNNTQPAKLDSVGNVIVPAVNFKGLEYQQLIPFLIKAIQEQQNTINNYKTRDSIQDVRLTALENAINQCCSNSSARNTNSNLNQLDVELSDKNAVVLNQNVPNPFAEQTTITYNVPTSIVKAQLLFYNGAGQIIQTVDITTRGKGKVNVFASDLSSGLYHYTLVVDGKVADSKKMVRE